jgi:hypothetical protein
MKTLKIVALLIAMVIFQPVIILAGKLLQMVVLV